MRAITAAVCLVAGLAAGSSATAVAPPEPSHLPPWRVPDIAALPDNEAGRLVRYGKDLLQHTTALIGPDAKDPAMRYAAAGLECSNCHLDAGTQRYGLPLVGIYGLYPAFSARSNRVVTMPDRVNDCMQRSLNGRPLPADSRELAAMVAYIRFLGSEQPPGEAPAGRGALPLPLPARAADPQRGRVFYERHCADCHGAQGQGVRYAPLDQQDLRRRYLFPPLWGAESYNDGAGMARPITAAWFVHANMPRGVNFQYPALKPEQAYDVAAYIDTQPRPHLDGLSRDYPDPWLKPVDAAFGPLLGPFPPRQRALGPWPPIKAWLQAHSPAGMDPSHHAAGDVEATSIRR